jgi:hypothetical protein
MAVAEFFAGEGVFFTEGFFASVREVGVVLDAMTVQYTTRAAASINSPA